MVDLGAKIKKKMYKFELKKKFQYVGHFKKKERPPIEAIKDKLRAVFAPKKPVKTVSATTAPPPGGFNFVVFGAFVFIALIIIGIGFLYLTTSALQAGANFQPQVAKPQMTNTIVGGEMLDDGTRNAPQYVGAAVINYTTSNIGNYTVTLTPYSENLPSEVFILDSQRFEASSYPGFLVDLRANLGKRNIILNEITLKQLETIPQGALVIVPSGVIPEEMLGFGSPLSMDKLVSRGVVVLYIGQPFDKMLNGTLVFTTPTDTVKSLPVLFNENANVQSNPDFNLYQPLYTVTGTGGYSTTNAYGSVSIVKKGDGAFIFVPQTLDGGWRGNASSAADDISRIVYEIPWATPIADNKTYTFVNQTVFAGQQYFFSNPFNSPSATVKVDYIGYSPTSNYPIIQTEYIRLSPQRNNGLYTELGGDVVPTNITGSPVRINAILREAQPAQPNMFLIIDDVNDSEQSNIPEGNVNVQADQSFDIQVYLGAGEYILKLIDDQGNTYAETYMNIVSPQISWSGNDNQHHSIYNFDITMAGRPFQLSDITVKVDGGKNGVYNFPQQTSSISVDVGQYSSGDLLPVGPHQFDFTTGTLDIVVEADHTKAASLFDNPLFFIVIILTGGLVGVGAIFARQEEVFFSIDIPDFPPVARTKIPLSPDVILSVFEKVNESYRWQNTPLTSAEVKNGFKNIFVSGKPVYITDYNVDFLLEDLEKKGLVKESIGYYGLVSWEEKSKHSIEYLALMRKLRDICVNNAIPFTSIGESPDADSVITVVGQQMSLHFYERTANVKELLERVMPTIGHGISIILFKNDADKEYFQSLINSSPSVAPLIVKMEADSSSLLLSTPEELEKMLLEFKSM